MECYPGETGPKFDECYALAFGVPGALMLVATCELHFPNSIHYDIKITVSDPKEFL